MTSIQLDIDITLYNWEPVAVGEDFRATFKIENKSDFSYEGGRLIINLINISRNLLLLSFQELMVGRVRP
jgi:hypothetical protein